MVFRRPFRSGMQFLKLIYYVEIQWLIFISSYQRIIFTPKNAINLSIWWLSMKTEHLTILTKIVPLCRFWIQKTNLDKNRDWRILIRAWNRHPKGSCVVRLRLNVIKLRNNNKSQGLYLNIYTSLGFIIIRTRFFFVHKRRFGIK